MLPMVLAIERHITQRCAISDCPAVYIPTYSSFQVTAVQVANNWSVPLVEGIAILEKFARKYENEDLHLEYLVRGVTTKAHVITVVAQAKLKDCEKKLDTFSKSLFSVSKKFTSNETINYKLETPKVINIRLDVGQRPAQTYVIPDARPAMEKPKNKPLFAPVEKKVKAEPEKKTSPEQTKQETTPRKDPKAEKSPEKGKSSLKKSAEKQNKGKPVPKIQMGKGSIASFFGNKPAAATSSNKDTKEEPDESPKAKKTEVVKPKEEPKSPAVDKTEDSSRKRTLSAGPDTSNDKKKGAKEPSAKKQKKEIKKVEKRSRIMAICDSDSDEEEAEKQPPEENRMEESDQEEIPATPKQETKKTSPDENRNPTKKRFKATRKVNKSYQDEDGFIRELVLIVKESGLIVNIF